MMGAVACCGCGVNEVSGEILNEEHSTTYETEEQTEKQTEEQIVTQLFHTRKEEFYDMRSKYLEYGFEESFTKMTIEKNETNSKTFKYQYDKYIPLEIEHNQSDADYYDAWGCNPGCCDTPYEIKVIDVLYSFKGDNPGVLDIGGIIVETTLKSNIGCPGIIIADINRDDNMDFIIEWQGYKYYDSIVVMSKGDTYEQVNLAQNMPDMSISVLDDYKMKVVSKDCDVDAEYIMANWYANNMFNRYKLYYDTGKAVQPGYNVTITSSAIADTEIYYGDIESIVAVKKMLMNNEEFTGISLVYYYAFNENGYVNTDIDIVNENCKLY